MTKLFKKQKLLMLSVVELLLFSSLAVSTIAWFSANKVEQVTTPSIKAGDGLTYKFKRFIGNNLDSDNTKAYIGYDDPDYVRVDANKKTVTNYDTDFISVTDSDFSTYLSLNKIYPGVRFTYAFEITNLSNAALNANIYLTSFTENYLNATYNNYVKEDSVDYKIGLGEAMDIYVSASTYENRTASANTFVTSGESTLTDGFNFSCSSISSWGTLTTDETTGSQTFTNSTTGNLIGSATSIPTNNQDTPYIVFMTIEYSNKFSTYYKFSSTDTVNNKNYYVKGATGDDISVANSNVYENCGLTFNLLNIQREQ